MIHDTRNIPSVPFKVGTVGPHTALPIAISWPIIFSWVSSIVSNLFPFKGDFSFGKNQKLQGTKSGCRGGGSPGWFDVSQKTNKQNKTKTNLCTRPDAWGGTLSWWSCQSPVAYSCGLLNYPNSFCGGMFKLNANFDAALLLCLLSHFKWDSHTIYLLTQWCLPPPLTRAVKLSWFMHAHSSPLSLSAWLHWCHANCSHRINNGWTFSRQISHIQKYQQHM